MLKLVEFLVQGDPDAEAPDGPGPAAKPQVRPAQPQEPQQEGLWTGAGAMPEHSHLTSKPALPLSAPLHRRACMTLRCKGQATNWSAHILSVCGY